MKNETRCSIAPKSIITGDNGAIVKIDEWGKKRLAYEIKDSFDGVYYILYFEASPRRWTR